jgi:toxin ParE1/3/4
VSLNFEIGYHPEAFAELLDAYDYYFKQSSFVADKFDGEVKRCEETISSDPLHYRQIDGMHKCVMINHPYIIYYLVTDRIIQIIAVAHQRRKPDYWQHRLKPS